MTVYSTIRFHGNQAMLRDEWLLTNGLGGFSGTTVSGVNTRKYHGLLISAFNPPVDRKLMVSKLNEQIVSKDKKFNLASNLINDIDIRRRKKNLKEIEKTAFDAEIEADNQLNIKYDNQGYRYLLSFKNNPYPTYTYLAGGVLIEKTIFMVYGENTIVVKYKILDTKEDTKLVLEPLLNCRDQSAESLMTELEYQIIEKENNYLKLESKGINLKMFWSNGDFSEQESYFEGMYYPIENYRGESDIDDHYIPGIISVNISEIKEFSIVFSTEDIVDVKVDKWEEDFIVRQQMLINKYPKRNNEFINKLILGADAFITYRNSTGNKTIMAGYPWFTDWGRDTMIALPGITLSTGRYEEAKEILTTFALNLKDGLLPNVFDDYYGKPGHYNTVDASLWFFYAIKKYYEATKDKKFIQELCPKLAEIIKYHKEGTRYNIKMDAKDGLLYAGEEGVQLTWMDAKINDLVVTPRHGKAVEINALWYNALEIFNELKRELSQEEENLDIIAKIKENFVKEFWYEEGQYLYDVITDTQKDTVLRPNQTFVISLPYPLLDEAKEEAVINKVYEELYTPVGMRSLAPSDSDYMGTIGGKRAIRDAAYHQGTTWGWLIGSFFEGYLKVNDYSDEAKQKVLKMYEPFEEHIDSYGIGNISEVFDGDFPNEPRGCYAQAWSVAELLRVYTEYLAE